MRGEIVGTITPEEVSEDLRDHFVDYGGQEPGASLPLSAQGMVFTADGKQPLGSDIHSINKARGIAGLEPVEAPQWNWGRGRGDSSA